MGTPVQMKWIACCQNQEGKGSPACMSRSQNLYHTYTVYWVVSKKCNSNVLLLHLRLVQTKFSVITVTV